MEDKAMSSPNSLKVALSKALGPAPLADKIVPSISQSNKISFNEAMVSLRRKNVENSDRLLRTGEGKSHTFFFNRHRYKVVG